MPETAARVNLLDFDRAGLRAFFTDLGEKPYRADQVMKWIYHRLEGDFAAMTDLGRTLRDKLTEVAEVAPPGALLDKVSRDGTRKWLLGMGRGNAVETVYIPEPARGTLCVSSQVGCALNCRFCSTGAQGFNRNLATFEIVGQLWHAAQRLAGASPGPHRITNVVMMGMGEPLLNFDNVVRAMSVMRDDFGFGLASRRVTLSTAGVVPMIDRLGEVADVSLAVSLHAPNDELRTRLVPLNKRWPIADLLDACARYAARHPRVTITFEYTLLRGVNDAPALARQLVPLMRRLPAKVNLIPFNPFPGTQYQCPDTAAVHAFQAVLLDAGVLTMVRRTRGDDIDAACGQLRGMVTDRTRRHAQWQRRHQSVPNDEVQVDVA